jgi:hypothetical protein
LRRTTGYTLFDHKRNEEILEELEIEPVEEKLRRYKTNCLQYVTKNDKQQDAKKNAEL